MATPIFAPLPPASVRLSLAPVEWEACLDVWLTLCQLTLRLPASQFDLNVRSDATVTLPTFLASFYSELGKVQPGDKTLASSKAGSLCKVCFAIVARTWTRDAPVPAELLAIDFLSAFSHAHVKSTALQVLMTRTWKSNGHVMTPMLQKQKDIVVAALESKTPQNGLPMLARLAPIMHASPDIASFFMTGTDFLDSILRAYGQATSDESKKPISTVAYLGLTSSVKTEPQNVSLVSDHLYSLKEHAEKSPPNNSLLADIVTNTPLIPKLRLCLGQKAPDRLLKLLEQLEVYRTPSMARSRRQPRRSRSKGKGKQPASAGQLNVHLMSLVTQVQDLFPDLGSGFVMKLLDEYQDDVEQVTAHLLDDSLPPHLADLDRSEQAPAHDTHQQAVAETLVPRSTPPPPQSFVPERRNVFDEDEFDRADFDVSRLHIGKRNKSVTSADEPNKAAILSALAAFDSDDDERDDTYDFEDVGGTVDNTAPDGEPGLSGKASGEENDMALFGAYQSAPEMFGRSFDVRKGQARRALKAETGMTDEQIEGWAIMLQRDPKRLQRLQAQTGTFDGRQTELAGTAYHGSAGNTETEDSDHAGRGGFRGRGRGRGRGGRGGGGPRGDVAGPSNDQNTANAQRKKEANKSSRANHNRRDQRARKMARGGFPG